ncbi:MAG: UDP-N-acetylmuramoyl-tripeptide--D-alanyl-D-alanine ligase, partial [Colwellia sp.]|nr:UDP-N-acetylmuramoyl-tripeptide--D-alanyl-D-alanine ligase [Colwellia sp.]
MIELDLTRLAQAANGRLICDESLTSLTVDSLITDTRADTRSDTKANLRSFKDKDKNKNKDKNKEAFLALKGSNFDGHTFIQQVITKGCQVLIVDHQLNNIDSSTVAQIIVDDTRIALGKIAAFVKAEVAPKTIGITGSSGKTTVKEMLAAILSRLGKVLATDGNFNNDIGVPLTLLRLSQHDDFAVIEMGANHLGEIAYTT